jgi:hypothetical protein
MSRLPRNLLRVAAALALAYVVIVVTWAIRPIDDAVPVGVRADGTKTSVTVECNSLFSADARDDEPLPTLDSVPPQFSPQAYQRTPCTLAHRNARILFGIDTIMIGGAIAALCLVAVRLKRRPPELII